MTVDINSIFQKHVNGTYTDNALLCQYILRYSLVTSKQQSVERIDIDRPTFTHRQLAKWLLKNNPDFYKGKAVKDSDIIEHTQKRVKKRLKDLELLGLVGHGKTKQQKGSAEIPLYVCSRLGYVLAEIIESLDPNKREKANNEIYDWFQIIYRIKEESPSTTIFYAHLFKKCKEKGHFGYIVSLFRKVVNSNMPLKNMFDLFNEPLFLIFNYPGRTDPFHITLNETLNELDVDTKKLFLYYQKLELEGQMKLRAGYSKGYEEMCFKIRGNEDVLAVEGFCVICQLYFPIRVDLLDYRERIIEDRNEMFDCLTKSCPKCKTPNALLIPSLIY
jgi:hypothetical protein